MDEQHAPLPCRQEDGGPNGGGPGWGLQATVRTCGAGLALQEGLPRAKRSACGCSIEGLGGQATVRTFGAGFAQQGCQGVAAELPVRCLRRVCQVELQGQHGQHLRLLLQVRARAAAWARHGASGVPQGRAARG